MVTVQAKNLARLLTFLRVYGVLGASRESDDAGSRWPAVHAGPAGGLALVMVYGFPDDSRIYDRVARCSPAAVVVAVDWLSNGYSDSPRKGTGYVAS